MESLLWKFVEDFLEKSFEGVLGRILKKHFAIIFKNVWKKTCGNFWGHSWKNLRKT